MLDEVNDLRHDLRDVIARACNLDLTGVPPLALPGLAAEMRRQIDILTAGMARVLHEADRVGALAATGAASAEQYLSSRTGTDRRDAYRTVALGDTLADAPQLADAVAAGEVSVQAAQVVGTVVDHDAFAAHGDELVDKVRGQSPPAARRARDQWLAHHDPGDEPVREARKRSRRYLSFTPRSDGLVDVRGVLSELDARTVENALDDLVRGQVDDGTGRDRPIRLVDALTELCDAYSKGRVNGGRERPTGLIVAGYDTLYERAGRRGMLATGETISAEDVRRLCCDAGLHRVITSGPSVTLDFGARTPTVSHQQWLALVERDGQCRFPGCDRPPGWCEAHHLKPRSKGGPTDLDNLALFCSRHHHYCHHPAWTVTVDADLTIHLRGPTGQHLTSPVTGRTQRNLFQQAS